MNGLAVIIVRLPSDETTSENIEERQLILNNKTRFYKNQKLNNKQLEEDKNQPK